MAKGIRVQRKRNGNRGKVLEFREKGKGIGRSGLGSRQMESDGIQRGERMSEGKRCRREERRKTTLLDWWLF